MANHFFIVRRFGGIGDSWSEHQVDSFDAVVSVAIDRVRDGKASGAGLEVIEMTEVRRVLVKPEISTVTVTEPEQVTA